MRKYLFVFISLTQYLGAASQQAKFDSLFSLLLKDKEDTNKIIHLNHLGWELMYNNPDTAILLGMKALSIAEKLQWRKGMASSYGNLGAYYYLRSDYPKALANYLEALKIDEALNDKAAIAKRLGNIGLVYKNQYEYSTALDYYLKALKIGQELADKQVQASTLSNIGVIYKEQKDYPKALDSYLKALKMNEELRNKKGIGIQLGNIGNLYADQKDYTNALGYYVQALKIEEELGDGNGIARHTSNLGSLYTDLGKFKEAERHLKKAITIYDSIGSLNELWQSEESLSQLYDTIGNHKLALFHYKKAITIKDTLFSQENKKQLVQKEMTFEFEKREAITKAEHEAEAKQQKIILWSVIGGLFLAAVFSVFILNRWRVTQKQKKIIEIQKHEVDEQKKLVEEKNKDITDSINYAQRIQKALLASDNLLTPALKGGYTTDYFVLFKPKDIVSGDFYWATEKDGRFYLAVCDCTGHGVPGAFMSLLNISFLNEAINQEEIIQPNEIFNHVRQRLIENISQDGGQDGMDGILVCFDKNTRAISYTSANNAPYLMNGALQELDTDSMPVGLGEKKDSFTHHTVSFQTGNILYLYTDGFADQFGGPKGKKFKYKQLNELLLANSSRPLTEQNSILEKTFEEWRGDLEQVDDMLIIGIKI